MPYYQFSDYIHILTNPADRKKTEVEIIWTAGGSYFEKKEDSGRKHLMEHCIASRTAKMNFQEFQDFQFRENIMLNAYTGPLTMGIEGSGHSSDFEKILDISLETALTPTFDQDILNQEKEIVLREISERRGDPNYRLHFQVVEQIFTPESYQVHQTLGSSKQVELGELGDFSRLHLENLASSPILVCCYGGGIKLDLIQKKLQEITQKTDLYQIQKLLEPDSKKAIDYQIPNHFQDFKKKAIVSDIAHKHAEINLYIPFKINFENKPAIKIFEELYLKFYGRIYDRLRNQLGLIYSMYGAFQTGLDCLYINLACEIEHIEIILQEIYKSFADFESNFEMQKLTELKNIILKKMEMTADNPYNEINLTKGTLTNFNKLETLAEYEKRLSQVGKLEIQKIYQELAQNLTEAKLAVVSKNPDIQQVVSEL